VANLGAGLLGTAPPPELVAELEQSRGAVLGVFAAMAAGAADEPAAEPAAA